MYKIVDESGKNSAEGFDSFNELYGQKDDTKDEKICSTYGYGKPVDLEPIRSKFESPKYVCRSCGRATSESSSLCSPEKL